MSGFVLLQNPSCFRDSFSRESGVGRLKVPGIIQAPLDLTDIFYGM